MGESTPYDRVRYSIVTIAMLVIAFVLPFAYRVDVHWWIFISAGLVAMVMAILTVIVQSTRAATSNPIKALRYE